MTIISAIIATSIAILFLFSDKIIEYYLPQGGIAQLSDEVDDLILLLDD